MSPVDCEKSLWFLKNPDACGGPGEGFYVQVKKCKRKMD